MAISETSCFTKYKLHAGCQKGWKIPFFVPGDLARWPWRSNSSERGTKHVFRVNLAQIHSAIPERFHMQTNNHRLTAPKTERFLSSPRVVISHAFVIVGTSRGARVHQERSFIGDSFQRRPRFLGMVCFSLTKLQITCCLN